MKLIININELCRNGVKLDQIIPVREKERDGKFCENLNQDMR
jgi:hypothetical protein